MKRIIFLMSISLGSMFLFTSCFEKIDNWYTETSEYDGRFVVGTTCEEYSSDDVPVSEGMEMWVFNTSNNVANEIWIDNFSIAGTHIKAKLTLIGDAKTFKTAGDTKLDEDSGVTYWLKPDGNPGGNYPPAAPTAAGITMDAVTLYTRISVDSAYIIKNAATTLGGNKSDSICLKTTLYHDAFQIISYETGPAKFAWKLVEGSEGNMDGWEEHWTISGYRYTGFPEDLGKKPPIVVK